MVVYYEINVIGYSLLCNIELINMCLCINLWIRFYNVNL